ncbi:MAG: formate dehydrogenase [Candidatus Methanomethylicota archaeon]|uniref:Formate dehydrogenase n=1 Tax=Thermoproteota archaeon TaxID=2056631 RepID=A0A497EX82_9CREN|nr:MAG: formate dehydrogenase [Candidatus Verstraetearchaeota archaeon]
MQQIKTVCARDCYDTCFLVALVENGKLIRVEGELGHPITRGFTCSRAAKDHERVYSSRRILYPHIRVGSKPTGKFVKASWSEAIEVIATKLKEVLEKFGPQAVLHLEYSGNMGLLTQYFPQRLWYAIGATRTDYSICSKSGHEAISLHYGLTYGIQPDELSKMKLIVYWGFNAAVSSPHLWALALKAKKRGALIAVVDPRKSESAEYADLWIQPKPGSDVALAYGVARYLIDHNYVDLDFIQKWTYGYNQFKEEAMKWTPEKVEDTTGVKWSLIEELGEAYGKLNPSATMIGIGFQKSIHGAESVRAVSLIPALLGLHRGFYYSNSQGWTIDIPYLTGEKLTEKKPLTVSQVALGKLLEKGEFKFIYIYNTNPTVTLPDQSSVRRGLGRSDAFVVVHDTHWTETAKYANVVLPAPTYLEKMDVVISYSHRYIRLSNKAIEPLGESKDEIWVMNELAKKLGLKEKWIYEDPWDVLRKALKDAIEDGIFEDLLGGVTLKLKVKPRSEYQTPTRKIEFYSKKAEELGLNPLPKQHPIRLSKDYFILLNSCVPNFTHTQFQEIYGPIPPIAWINVEDAKSLNIKNGDTVELYNELGRVKVKAIVTNKVPRGVIWSPRQLTGLNQEPQNKLIPCETQLIGGGSTFNSTLIKIQKSN